jgi:hypothetical protein
MRFLNRLWIILTGYFRAATNPKLSLDALLNRFLTHKNQFSSERVKQSAFMPRNMELSVFHTNGLKDDQIWILGERYVSPNIYGRAEITHAAVSDLGLKVELDNKPQRHANIIGWPAQKSEQKLYALKLAEESSLSLRTKQIEG